MKKIFFDFLSKKIFHHYVFFYFDSFVILGDHHGEQSCGISVDSSLPVTAKLRHVCGQLFASVPHWGIARRESEATEASAVRIEASAVRLSPVRAKRADGVRAPGTRPPGFGDSWQSRNRGVAPPPPSRVSR